MGGSSTGLAAGRLRSRGSMSSRGRVLLGLIALFPAAACTSSRAPAQFPMEDPLALDRPMEMEGPTTAAPPWDLEAAIASLPAATDGGFRWAPAPLRWKPSFRAPGEDAAAADSGKEKSADEVARSLANPNTPLATLTFKNQFNWYKGDLPDSREQSSYTLLFQPSFPFPVGSEGDVVFWRPALPLLVSQPVPTASGGWDQKTEIGDLSMDLGYGTTSKEGRLTALGTFVSMPTGTSKRAGSTGRWAAGPEALLAQFDSWGLYGIFPSHMWDFAGTTDNSINVTSTQVFLVFLPGNGWTVGSTPRINYEWEGNGWTVPVNLTVSKTVVIGETPVKLGIEVNYYVRTPRPFGPHWQVSFNIAPVVENVLDRLF